MVGRAIRRGLAPVVCAVVALGIGAGGASAAPVAPHVLRADVQIERFVVNHSGLTALGTQSARLAGSAARQKATFSVTKGSSCNVLTLNLQQLNLQLLGLNLVTGAINLKITGRTGQSLGALFCRLAQSLKLTSATGARAAAASLNRHLHGRPLHALRLQAALPVVTAQAAQAPTTPGCKVLDLVLGPLNLDLLGLVVDLYGADATKPVEVHVTADPAGGVLGAVFCKLASGQAVG